MRLYKLFISAVLLLNVTNLTNINITSFETNDALIGNALSGILIDATSGKIMYERNVHQRLAPASMTKIMTLSIIFDEIKEGNLSFTDYITTSEHAASMGGSQIYLEVGEQMTLEDMIKAIAISSANDAAVAVSEKISGSEGMFVNRMNEKAIELGLTNTNFQDVTGLTSTNHFSSAFDMAMMSKHLIQNHGDNILRFTSIRTDKLRVEGDNYFGLTNTNKLIGKVDGVDGLKTGWTNAAGYSLAATKYINGNRLISVVMGYSDPKLRNSETVQLLNYGFSNFKFNELLPANHVVKEIKNIRFNPSTFKIVTSRSVISVDRLNEQTGEITYEVILNELNDTLEQGQVVGYLNVFLGDTLIDTVDLIVQEYIRKNNFFQLILQVIKMVLI